MRKPVVIRLAWLAVATALPVLAFVPDARTQTDAAALSIEQGDGAMSGFSGTVLSTPSLAPNVDPLDKTVIDVDGPSVRIYDLSALGGAPAGQIVGAPVKFSVPAKDIGQVFALAFDEGTATDPPSLYAGATSAYGIQIVSTQRDEDGSPVRVRNGAPDVRFMEGQFGSLPGAGPGTIYRIDGRTGEATVLANLGAGDAANSGPGVGGLAFDPASRTLYASDLDTGLVHGFALDQSAAERGRFDHGVSGRPARGFSPVEDDGKRMDVTKPTFKPDTISTYGFTQAERRVRALAVHDGRLYYAVDDGPEIWSVALGPDGSFIPGDVRSELLVKADRKLPVTGIAFDGEGRMILAQRGALKNSYDYGAFVEPGGAQLLRYAKENPDDPATPGIWAPDPQSYAAGFGEGSKAAAGGVAMQYGYRPDGSIDLQSCHGTIAATVEGLAEDGTGHGLQLGNPELVSPTADALRQAAFVEFDRRRKGASLAGHVGTAAMFHGCPKETEPEIGGATGYPSAGGAGYPAGGGYPTGGGYPPVAGGGGGFPPAAGGGGEGFPPIGAFPPVEAEAPPIGEPPATDAPAQADQPEAADTNLAVTKSQSCKLLAADKAECEYTINMTNTGKAPFQVSDLSIEDRFSVPPAAFTSDGFGSPEQTADSLKTRRGRLGAVSIEPGAPAFSPTIKATFDVPAGGLSVENCVTIVPAPAGAPLIPPFTPVEPLPDQPDLPAGTSDALDHAIAISGTPQCVLRGDLRDCSWTVTLSNPSLAPLNQSFSFKTSKPAVGIGGPAGLAATRKDDTTTIFASSEALASKAVKSFTIKATFLAEPAGPVSATASLTAPLANDINAANNTSSAEAGTAEPEVVPSPGVTSKDGNPDDNTSCIRWNSNTPDDQGTPTNAPTSPPPPPQTGAGGLDIKKTAIPGSCRNNRSCDFKIVITNTGTEPFKGPAEFDDTVTGDGAFFGATTISKEPGSPWTCAKSGQSFKCTAPNFGLLPKASFDFVMGFDLGPGTGALKEMKNCAKLKDAKDASCATIPFASPLKLAKTATVASCTHEGGCAFEVKIENTGPAEVPGPINLTETVTVNGAFVGTMSPTFPPPWACSNIAPTFGCFHPDGIPAGGSISLPISFRIGSPVAEGATIKNCVTLEGLDGTVCAEIPVVPAKASLTIQNVALAPTCPLKGPCRFKIDINNAATQPYNGALAVNSTVWSGAGMTATGRASYKIAAQVGNTPWACTPTGPLTLWRCQLPTLTGGTGNVAGLTFSLTPAIELPSDGSVTTSSEWDKNNILTLCAQLGIDPAGNDDIQPNKPKQACASVRLDPFAVEIKKSGSQSCAPGSECRFDLEIFNPGPILHDDPVTVTDNLTGLGSAPIVSIEPAAGAKPFPCSPAPTQIPFTCSGHMRLEVNERHKYVMTVKLPESPATGSFTNCASIASGSGAVAATPADESCHAVTIAEACSNGMVLNEDGRCACPENQTWQNGACAVREEACPPGTTGTPPDCKTPSSSSGADTSKSPPSDRGPERSAPPGCDVEACAAKYKSFRASDCTFGTRRGRLPCKAKSGGSAGSDTSKSPSPKSGGSAGSDTSKSPARCPPSRPVGTPPNCCPKSMQFRNGACRCPEGTELKSGRCVAVQRAPQKCPRGTELKDGTCVRAACPPGTVGVPPFCSKKQDAPPEKKKRDPAEQGAPPPPKAPPPVVPRKQCKPPKTGVPPYCRCPAGTEEPNCTPPKAKKAPPPAVPLKQCRPPKTGIFPNCRCPPGTEGPDCTPPFRAPR